LWCAMTAATPPPPPQSARLQELQDRAAALRAELHSIEAAIEAEASLLHTVPAEESEAAPVLHHRPSYSLFGGGAEAAVSSPTIRKLEAHDEDWDAVLAAHPELEVAPIGAFNHWDRRECAVPEHSAALWRAKCAEHVEAMGGKGNIEIPRVIHQIWIGPREPPCLWIDTFRVEYLAAHPGWGFELWSDDKVAELPMLNEKIYTEEKMWQCKADILRLEFLWHHGGLYVDADMISVDNKSLEPIIECGRETGFVIAYEPDTKDKPYSILGNSVIACTPHHPLILMLILYLKHTFYHKRWVTDVFVVTGPVMYTKCLVDCNMPISIAAQELLYPAFHFVPNPDAINFAAFPKCLMFQFGYTCSGLEGYVKSKNRCKKARICPFHSKKEWPLGRFRALPTVEEVDAQFAKQGGAIPTVIHQLTFGGGDSVHDPIRWRQSWWEDFMRANPGFTYKTWTKQELLGKEWFCSNLYTEPLDDHAVTVLMLEILFNEGGYYVPLSTVYKGGGARDPWFASGGGGADFVEGAGGILGAARGSGNCFRKILELYDHGQVPPLSLAAPPAGGPSVLPMGFRDGALSQARFPRESKYLGAGQIVVHASGAGDARTQGFAIAWAYECMVPCILAKGDAGARAAVAEGGPCAGKKVIFVTDRELLQMDRIRAELPGLLDRMPHGWDVMLFGMEWQTNAEEVVSFNVPPGGRPANSKVAGFVANFESASHAHDMRQTVAACFAEERFDPSPLFDAAGRLSLWFGAEKYARSIEEARIWRSLPIVSRCFIHFAGHHPPVESDNQELHGNLMKGWLHGRLRFEVVLEPSGGIMFRAWNEDNSTNCEMKTNGTVVEWMKVFFNHQVAKEVQNQPIP